MHKILSIRACILLLAGLYGPAAVQPAAAEPKRCDTSLQANAPLTLSAAVDTALCLNARTASAWAAIDAQTAQVGLAKAAYLPTINGSITAQTNATQYPGSDTPGNRVKGHTSYLGLNWRLFDFGERAANEASAVTLLSAAMASHDDAVRKTLSDTVQAYFAALQARTTLDAKKYAAELSQKTVAAAQRREAKGVTSRSDTLQAETAHARARLAQQRAKADFDKAITSLVYVIGVATDTPLTLPEHMAPVPATDLPPLSELLTDARASHPAILAARAQRDASERSIAAARSEGRPTVDFSVSRYQNGYPNQSIQATRSNTVTAGITLTIPIFDGFARKFKIDQARAQADKSAIQALDTEYQVLGDLIKSHADAVSSLENLDASKQLIKAASASLESASNRYEHGVGDILELIIAQNAIGDAMDVLGQFENQWDSARLKLMIETGRIDRARLTAPDSAAPTP
ncbi:hypothetical protein CDN99_11905 [Roseateles aquatilis]|uniref:Protein CyaE n=1 Tax=Roseateles aquatilis TaxID=431061 RepID=A0A246JE34_9BURK|nr:TolC family protein [Roseateles aquatilis]OWQ90858.1 hypothetical protein CDN99_11905 [Roseateles aquatilis]